MCACMLACMCVCGCMCVLCVCTCVSIYVWVRVCEHVCVCDHMCLCTRMCVHTYVHILSVCMGNTHVCALRIGGEFSCTVSILVMKDYHST